MTETSDTYRITVGRAAGVSEEQLLVALLTAFVRLLGPDAVGHAKGVIAGPGGRFWASATDVHSRVGSGPLEGATGGAALEGAGSEGGRRPGRGRGIEARVSLLFVGIPREAVREAAESAVAEVGQARGLKISVRLVEEARDSD